MRAPKKILYDIFYLYFYKKFGKAFLQADGLAAILSFTKDDTFIKQHQKYPLKTFERDDEQIAKLLKAIIPALSQVVKEYLDFLAKSNKLDKNAYEAYFLMGIICKHLKTSEQGVFLENNAARIVTKTLKSLSEKKNELKFDNETNIEISNKPKFDEKNFRESIFSYILYIINILCKDLVSNNRIKMKYLLVLNDYNPLKLPWATISSPPGPAGLLTHTNCSPNLVV